MGEKNPIPFGLFTKIMEVKDEFKHIGLEPFYLYLALDYIINLHHDSARGNHHDV